MSTPKPGRHRQKRRHAGNGTQAGSFLRRDWAQEPAVWETGSSGSVRERGDENTAIHAQVSLGKHATEKTEISAQEPTVVPRFYSQAILQRRVLD